MFKIILIILIMFISLNRNDYVEIDQSQTTHGKIVSEGKLPSTAK